MSPNYQNVIEAKAHSLRDLCGVKTFDRLDPFFLAKTMNVDIITPQEIPGLPPELLNRLLVVDSAAWSAGTIRLPGSKCIVVMNPTHQKTRQNVSLMEELSHIHLNHRPSQIMSFNGSNFFRDYNKAQEKEAYSVGAAALLPRRILKGAHTLNLSAQDVAAEHEVSLRLVQFRCNMVAVRLRFETEAVLKLN